METALRRGKAAGARNGAVKRPAPAVKLPRERFVVAASLAGGIIAARGGEISAKEAVDIYLDVAAEFRARDNERKQKYS